ncbi:hypothetical protein ACFQH6_17865 [Halobacteriaceae archaeon GCM10025711]
MTRWEHVHRRSGELLDGGADPTAADLDDCGEQDREPAASLTEPGGRPKRETDALVFEPPRE